MLQAQNDFVIIQRAEKAEKTAGGLYMPQSASEDFVRGVLVAVGPGISIEDVEFGGVAGETVVYDARSVRHVQDSGVTYDVVRISDVVAIVTV